MYPTPTDETFNQCNPTDNGNDPIQPYNLERWRQRA